MLDSKEYKKINLDFRRVSSNFLRTEYNNQDVPLRRFYNYIEKESVIKDIISNKIDGIDYDFHDCFGKDEFGRSFINIPFEEEKHIKAMYDYLKYIAENNVSLYCLALKFPCGSRKITDYLQNFIDIAFKPLINYIQDELSKIMIMDEGKDMKEMNNYGVINFATDNSVIKSNNIINQKEYENITNISDSIKEALKNINMDEEEKENIIDDIEEIQEQLNCSIEKPTRFKKAFKNIKAFLTNTAALTGAGVSFAKQINELIILLQPFVDKIG